MRAVSANRRRILSLWLPRLPIDRIKRQLTFTGAPPESKPQVVVIKDANALLIHALDEAAARHGVSLGQPLANARAVCPDLVVHEADLAADAEMLEGIAD